MSERVGWFADVDPDQGDKPWKWQPCLETGTGHIPCFEVWFETKEACEAYIRDDILPIASTMLPDYHPDPTPNAQAPPTTDYDESWRP